MNEGTAAAPAAPFTLLSPDEVWDRVDPLAPDLGADPAVSGLRDLPYPQLLGAGFERLCYELLVAEGHSPRFFGRSGQKDYGVDIIVEAGDTRTVYQCKNIAAAPAWTDVRDAVAKFESDWLGEAGLPCPQRFVYCCPHPLDDKELGESWTRSGTSFAQEPVWRFPPSGTSTPWTPACAGYPMWSQAFSRALTPSTSAVATIGSMTPGPEFVGASLGTVP